MSLTAAWQHGYDLQYLKSIGALFDRQRSETLGRHETPNEAVIATALHERRCLVIGEIPAAVCTYRILSRDVERIDFTGRRVATARAGDCIIDHIATADPITTQILDRLCSVAGNRSIWLRPLSHQTDIIDAAHTLGFTHVMTQIAASSDIRQLMVRTHRLDDRRPSSDIDAADLATLTQIGEIDIADLTAMCIEVSQMSNWADHYSQYNLRKSWSAISLQGYSTDPTDIIKPSDMSQSWKKANEMRLIDTITETTAAQHTPHIMRVVRSLGWRTERIRLMRLRATDGGLSRHADIVDRDAGTADGHIARLHIPLQTSPACTFLGWQADGTQIEHHLMTGSLWYLDIRKPHAVTNVGSTIDRIHLVIDIRSDERLRAALR